MHNSTLPIDARTGIRALGIINGRVVWPIAGASEPAPEPPADPPASPDAPADPPAAPETDWKAEARKWEQRAKENHSKAQKLDEIETANQTELEKAQKVAEANEQRARTATLRAVTAEAKVLATAFANPAVAVQLLGDLTRFVNDDGEIDDTAITKELAGLLERESYLAKPVEPTPEPRPGQPSRPTETLRPGAAPAEPERATNLFDAVAQALSPNN